MNDSDFFTDSLGQKWRKDYFTYSVSIDALAAGTSQTGIINIESDSQFVWTKTNYLMLPDAGTTSPNMRPLARVTVAITDSGSGRQLQSIPNNISNIAGVEGLPFVLPQPRLFKENSSISLVFFNGDTNPYDIFMSLSGYKLFRV